MPVAAVEDCWVNLLLKWLNERQNIAASTFSVLTEWANKVLMETIGHAHFILVGFCSNYLHLIKSFYTVLCLLDSILTWSFL